MDYISTGLETNPKIEDDSTSKQILEYYRKYSQNQALTKYFSGTPLSYLPEIKDDYVFNELPDSDIPNIIIESDVDIILVTNPSTSKENEQSASSPTSSVNHKLEWDSLADIGYTNTNITKQFHISNCLFPSLSEKKDETQKYKNTPSDGMDNIKLIIFPYSSGSEEVENLKDYSSSSSFPEDKKMCSSTCSNTSIYSMNIQKPCTSSSQSTSSEKISHFKNTLSYLKKKIGLPDAHSTPNIDEKHNDDFTGISETPIAKQIEKPIKNILTNEDYYGSFDILENEPGDGHLHNITQLQEQGSDGVNTVVKRVINLCQTEPLALECIPTQPKFENKNMQTKSKYQINVAVQTLPSSEKNKGRTANQAQQNVNQCLMHENHSETNKINLKSTGTGSEISHSDSFNPIKKDPLKFGSEIDVHVNKVELSNDVGNNGDENSNNKNNNIDIDYCQISSEDIHMANAIVSSTIENPSDYIEKYIHLFQRLLRSKKYDSVTKKHYLKKIIKKITESKYLEESSTSSDLFLPKKYNSNSQTLPNVKFATSTDSTEEKSLRNNSSKCITSEGKLHKKRTFQIKSSHQDIMPNASIPMNEISNSDDIVGVDVESVNNSIIHTNKESFNDNQSTDKLEQKSNHFYSDTVSSNVSKDKQQYGSTSTSKSYKNWKDNKTISEKILDQINLPSCDGDYLIKVANEDRNYQVNCIETKMNKLVNSSRSSEKQPVELLTMKSQKMVPKTTSAYTVSEKSDNELIMRRNFVIQTNLGAGSSKNKFFCLDGRKYVLENSTNENKNSEKSGQVFADLEIVLSDTTTNIKVTTSCENCKTSPCVCQCQYSKDTDQPRSHRTHRELRKNVCYKCSKLCCSCSSTESKSGEWICSFCCTSPCLCTDKFKDNETRYEFAYKKCMICGAHSSHCTHDVILQEKCLPTNSAKVKAKMKKTSEGSANSSVQSSKCEDSSHRQQINTADSFTKSAGTATISSLGTLDGSLIKLFSNCKCNLKTSCNCGFVDKLLKHFSKEDLVNFKRYESKISQTEHWKDKSSCNNIGVQVQVYTQNQNSQTFSNLSNQISQTSKSQRHSQDVGIQTSAIVPVKIPRKTEVIQVGSQDQNTLTKAEDVRVHQLKNNINQRNAAPQTLYRDLEIIQSIDTELEGNNRNEVDDYTQTNLGYVSNDDKNDEVTNISGSDQEMGNCKIYGREKRHITTSSNSSHILVPHSIEKSSENIDGQTNIENANAGGNKSPENDMYLNLSSMSPNETSSGNTVSENSATSDLTCICCKMRTNIENVSLLRSNNQEYPLCHHCLGKKPILTSVCYTGPEKDVVNDTNATSDSFRRMEEYCTCTKQSKSQNGHYCFHCQFKLKKTVRSRNAIAYTLTLENETPRKFKSHKKKTKRLEEIKVKVPCPSNRKTFKNEENSSKRDVYRLHKRESSLRENIETERRDIEKSTGHVTKNIKKNLTLQEYLMTNRPDFMNSAEYRRRTVVTHKVKRQLDKEKIKLRLIENNLPEKEEMRGITRLFTEKEMRDITNKNYQKLPEVQHKLVQSREQRLRYADKFIVGLFKKNIQGSVLKGKRSFPLNTNIVNMQA
ncbi:unnamed protein product [Phaedon cochleariae]|uniref:ALMS motif domain-containing protein n=1 Tax=Phaedon cochleariae TaxID=80249 RepID=A0A9P0GWF7_PHACE|nr:unnamed protein product [Phaedon cochleariae]